MPKGTRVDIFEGQRFYDWTVVKESLSRKEKRFVVCKCDCGTEKEVVLTSLLQGISKSCEPCASSKRQKTCQTGEQFGDWTVISDSKVVNGRHYVMCQCNCGDIHEVSRGNLTKGISTKCRKCANSQRNENLKLKIEPGQVFGNRTIIKELPKRKTARVFLCKCVCGHEVETQIGVLTSGAKVKCYVCLSRTRHNPLDASAQRLYKSYQSSAKSRKLDMDLTFEEFKNLTQQDCFYCGEKPSKVIHATAKTHEAQKNLYNRDVPVFIYNGIDRLDSSEGYTIENSVPCCNMCNMMKQATPVDAFLKKIFQIYIFQNPSILEKDIQK